MTVFSERIGKKIILARQQRNVSQSELARQLNITQQCLSNYEHGTRQIPLDVFSAICAFLQAPLSWFLPELQQYGEVISEADVEFLRELKRYAEPEAVIDFLKTVKSRQSNGRKQRCLAAAVSAE